MMTEAATAPTPARKQTLMAIITIVISVSLCWFIADFFLGWYQERIAHSSKMEPGLMRYHSQLGWTLSPSWQGRHHHYDFDVSYSTNMYSLRNGDNSKPFLPHKKNKTRTALVGDSFTFGFGVNDRETFHAQLSQLDPDTEYLNAGTPGYSTDQQYLFIQEKGKALNIDHYFLIFYLGNDILDNPLPYPLQAARGKPFFELHNQQLQLKNTPVPKQDKTAALQADTLNSIVFGNDLKDYSNPINHFISSNRILSLIIPQQAATDQQTIDTILQRRLQSQEQLLNALLKAIKKSISKQGAQLSLVLLPGQSYIVAPDSYSAYFQDYVRRQVTAMGKASNIAVIDIAWQLRQKHQAGDIWFHPHEGHLTIEGHRQVAEILLQAQYLNRD